MDCHVKTNSIKIIKNQLIDKLTIALALMVAMLAVVASRIFLGVFLKKHLLLAYQHLAQIGSNINNILNPCLYYIPTTFYLHTIWI